MWVEQAGGGREKITICIKIGFREPHGTEKRKRCSTLADSSRLFLGGVTLDYDWLPKNFGFWAKTECVW